MHPVQQQGAPVRERVSRGPARKRSVPRRSAPVEHREIQIQVSGQERKLQTQRREYPVLVNPSIPPRWAQRLKDDCRTLTQMRRLPMTIIVTVEFTSGQVDHW